MTITKISSLLKGSILAAAFLVLFLSLPAYAAEKKDVMIDGIKYTLFLGTDSAWASLEMAIPDISGGEDYSELTVHNEITYEGKTYKVEHFDYGHDEESETEGMVIREPYRLSYYQKHLKKLTIEEGIPLLYMGFSNYLELEEVVFEDPKDMEECGLYFYNCPKLKDIYIPADIDVMPRLRECPNTKVTFAPDHPKYKVMDGDIYSKNGKILYDVPNGSKNYKVKNSVKEIAVYAFYGNDNIRNIKMSSSVKKIRTAAFGDMKNLKSVKLSKNLKVAQNQLFRASTKLKALTYPKKVRTIWGGFGRKSRCGLKKIYIKAKKLKKIQVNGLPKTCKVYVKNNTVRDQVRAAGFKGQIIVQ